MDASKVRLLKIIGLALLIVALIIFALVKCSSSSEDVKGTDPTSNAEGVESNAEGTPYSHLDAAITDASEEHYANTDPISFTANNGQTFSIGAKVDEGSSNTNGLYLNPTCSSATKYNKIGFYITSSSTPVIYSFEQEPVDKTNSALSSETCCVIFNSYSELCPLQYVSPENYGAKWSYDKLNGDVDAEKYIDFRAVNLETNQLQATFRVYIEKNSKNEHYFSRIENLDIPEGDVRTAMLTAAQGILDSGMMGFSKSEPLTSSSIIVQSITTSYFNSYTTLMGEETFSASFVDSNMYAVTINLDSPTLGFLTVYIDNRYDVESGTTSQMIVGYDKPLPLLNNTAESSQDENTANQ